MNAFLNQLHTDNEIIFRTLKYIDYLYNEYGDGTHSDYFHKQKYLQKVTDVELPNTVAGALRVLLEDAQIKKLKENIYKIKNPSKDISLVDPADIEKCNIFDLNDTELVNYFALFSRGITINEHNGMALVKYSPVIYETGWSKLTLLSRGKVIDLNDWTIVSYPYDKFFNINENEDYNEKIIANLINNARSVYVTDKKDGSLIAVSRLANGEVLVTTNGSFDNMHIGLAKKMLAEKYSKFYNNLLPGKTYIFEIIHPEDNHCISYGDVKKMYLHGVRDLNTYALADYEELEVVATAFDLDLIEREYINLVSMQEKVHEKNANKEGWVVRIVGQDGSEKIVKIKYDEYFLIHRLRCGVNVKKIYNHYVFVRDIQETLHLMTPDVREATLSVIEEININRQKIADYVASIGRLLCVAANVECGNLTVESKKAVWNASQMFKNTPDDAFIPLVLTYVNRGSATWQIENLRYAQFELLVMMLERHE
jgi:hypothetical protein